MGVFFKRFAGRLALTMSLVVLEAAGWILFPLVIGRAIDSVLAASPRGLYELGALGVGAMLIGTIRRLVDSRAYARIYVCLGEEMVGADEESDTSTRTARLGMLREIVGFFEHSLPQLITGTIALAGAIVILSTLNVSVFLGCVAVAVATCILYALTRKLTTRYNKGLNDEYERQVDAVDSGDPPRLGEHLRAMTRWNIRLSDLEAGTFGINWVFMMALLVYAVGASAEQTVEYGAVFAIVMYVFRFMNSMTYLPFYYQRWLRLREISGRLARLPAAAE